MGISSIKVNNTSYPISPLIYEENKEIVIGSFNNKDIVSWWKRFGANDVSMGVSSHGIQLCINNTVSQTYIDKLFNAYNIIFDGYLPFTDNTSRHLYCSNDLSRFSSSGSSSYYPSGSYSCKGYGMQLNTYAEIPSGKLIDVDNWYIDVGLLYIKDSE